MKRLHVHISVEDLDKSVGFYGTLFGAEPTVVKPDYAKWLLDDPRVNFAISTFGCGRDAGIEHVGIQTDDKAELDELSARLKAAGQSTLDQQETTCCYAVSDKSWVKDPSGVRWETFFTHGEAAIYGVGTPQANQTDVAAKAGTGCCS